MRFSSDCLTGVPIEMMDQGGLSSIYAQEIRHSSERQVGLWNHEFMGDTYGSEGTSGISNSKTVTSLHHQRLLQAHSLENLERPLSSVKVQKSKLHPNLNGERMPDLPMNSWGLSDQDLRTRKNMCMQHASVFLEEGKIELGKPQYENGLFSSSLSEIFDKKLRLVPSDILLGHSVDRVTPSFEEEEPYQSLKEMEAQMIGNLLPDDEELLSGVVDDIECIAQPSRDDMEDLDLFSSGGGMELELDNNSSSHGVHKVLALDNCMLNCNLEKSSNTVIGEPYPCRTLFVRNINTNIDDSELKLLFQKYGDIRTLYTACKPQGFVMISYYDIRAAADARCSLQNKPLKNQNLDIQYSFLKDNLSEKETNQGILVLFNLDSSVSNKDLCKIFGVYGDVKEIRDSHNGCHSKFIEFYDTRAAEAALHALNNSDIAGKRIMLESIHSVATKQGMIDMAPEFEGGLGLRQQRNLPDNLMSGSFLPGLIPPSFLANKSLSVPLSSIAAPVDPFMEAAFSRISTGVPYSISPSSAVSVVSNHDNQLAYDDLNNSLGQLKVGASCVQSFHPHSLPDYHNPLSSCAPYRINNNSEHVEGRKGNCPVHGNYAWRNSPSHHPYCMSPMMWSNSPPVANGVHPLPPHQLPRIPRAPSHLPNNILLHNHHVGSAPSMNPSFWDRPHVYNRDSSETHHFHPGSLGTRNPFEISGHNIFPHGGGNCVDLTIPSTNPGLHSPQHICHMFPSRNPSVPVPSSNSTNERSRSRRNEANVNSSDNKKQYELDIDRILRGEDNRTTLMIKNIPNKYTSKMLLVTIDERHRGTYDFIYLPIDFKNKCNVGYAFINMTDPKKIVPFFESFNGKKWEKFNSEKVASLAYARIQGKSALIAHFQNSSLMNEDKRCRPIIFHTEGPNAGDQEPFPTGTDIRCRGSKVQNSGDDENLYKSPPKYINGESSPHGVELSIPTEDHL